MSKSSKTLKNVICSADHAALEEGYTFVPSEEKPSSWQERMVQRYHEGLYKEFAMADLSRPGKVGLRWRTRQEVMSGRGEKSCGNKRCHHASDLTTLEVPFSYVESGVAKKELVKLRLCPLCRPLVDTKSSKSSNSQQENGKALEVARSKQDANSSSESEVSEDSRSQKKRKRKKHRKCHHKHKKKKQKKGH